jgi:hypothetical protein
MAAISKLLRVAHCRYERRSHHGAAAFYFGQLLAGGVVGKDTLNQVGCAGNPFV